MPSGETRVTPKFTRDVKTPDPIFHLKYASRLSVIELNTSNSIHRIYICFTIFFRVSIEDSYIEQRHFKVHREALGDRASEEIRSRVIRVTRSNVFEACSNRR
ncbi:hypothetical protein PUN28_000743 [Cardiocondyla obscurior]|uniref:Uncharacterized protein n=1 Tax=Cardiocondyla obscurior TaxID=286306 RepID=A0AAW2H0W4_9HYME